MITREDVNKSYTYHPPNPTQTPRYEVIRAMAKDMALYIIDNTPSSREQSLAMTKLDEFVMWANAAIARNE